MASGKSGGAVGKAKPVPSWLNSPAWSSTPRPRGRNFPESVEKGSKAKDNVKLQRTGSDVEKREEDGESDNVGNNQDSRSSKTGNVAVNSSAQLWSNPENPSTFQGSLSSAPSSASSDSEQSFRRSSSLDARVELFMLELSRKRTHIAELQRMSAQGIPDVGSIRATTWKLLLGYLPRNREDWSIELKKKRAEYTVFREELLVNPSELTRRKAAYEEAMNESGGRGFLPRHDITHDDHPLSLGSTSVWHQFFQDTELSEQIDRDVKRTHPDIQFFCGDSEEAHENQEALRRALFIFAKLNPGIRYVQGMNEVLAPLYYVFKTDPDESYAAHAEPDAFFCFVELLSDFRDHFCQQLDNSAVGIRSTISQLNALLRKHDEELWRHLEVTSKVNPQFYAFRWITLLLTQEFDFLDCLRLWDSLLSNPDGPLEILLRVCCAMLLCVRSRLLAGDFTTNLKLLQNYPTVDIHHLLRVAEELRG
ncbi:TBC1 domain family member 13 [Marchantia polymorpha subsp. ruderalis]|uniref:Rab-GAP TBC domain-containing protein n=2 Tax=Marchantia polymorpha TaxID=3197 RepID=A0A176VT45_MARPO|nr:hypothetical protein AXG93_4625s1060 [Marchantia polymorpha subsp. ruderalis]PTQ29471.1 hypothetical protein MARPO_0140s0008 [Marchantia polymorpha]BBN06097.1 hypothetical protein Mp_3g18340 [Marchantia polymorpha subsp. ruderalis]|eukprot:PTQ29471.1 hypothetical protein MARPO_0140s0008 [Marchantia polymorpha]